MDLHSERLPRHINARDNFSHTINPVNNTLTLKNLVWGNTDVFNLACSGNRLITGTSSTNNLYLTVSVGIKECLD